MLCSFSIGQPCSLCKSVMTLTIILVAIIVDVSQIMRVLCIDHFEGALDSKQQIVGHQNTKLEEQFSSMEPVYFENLQDPDQYQAQIFYQQHNLPVKPNPRSNRQDQLRGFYNLDHGLQHSDTYYPPRSSSNNNSINSFMNLEPIELPQQGSRYRYIEPVNAWHGAKIASNRPVQSLINKTNKVQEIPQYIYPRDDLRTKKPLNFTEAIDSGEVLFGKKSKNNTGIQSSAIETMSLADLKDLLQRLAPLELSSNEEPSESEEEEEGEQANSDQDASPHVNQTKVLPDHKASRLERRAPNVIFDDQLYKNTTVQQRRKPHVENSPTQSSSLDEIKQAPDLGSKFNDEENLMFLKSLANIDKRAPRPPLKDEPLEAEYPLVQPALVGRPEIMQLYEMKQPPPVEPPVMDPKTTTRQVDQSVPIDELVDRLMSNSRLASFGVQHVPKVHSDNGDGETSEEDGDDVNSGNDDEGTDSEDDESSDNNDDEEEEEDPDGDEQESEETAPVGVVQALSSPMSNLNFSSAFNRKLNDSWTPLAFTEAKKRPQGDGVKPPGVIMVSPGQLIKTEIPAEKSPKDKVELANKRNKKRKGAKGKRRKRKKTRKGFNLVVGGRILSKTEVIKLIEILNKMASSSKSEKERYASKKLLRFLIKLVLDEYQRNKKKKEAARKKNRKTNGKDPIRELLRSVLLGPVDANKTESGKSENSIELRPVVEKQEIDKVPLESIGDEKTGTKKIINTKKEEPSQVEEKNKVKGLGELSNELEHYFDEDFFEDMADRNKSGPLRDPKASVTTTPAPETTPKEMEPSKDENPKEPESQKKRRRAARSRRRDQSSRSNKLDSPEDRDYDSDLDRDPEIKPKRRPAHSDDEPPDRPRPRLRRRPRRRPRVENSARQVDPQEEEEPEEEEGDEEEEEEEPTSKVNGDTGQAKASANDHHLPESSNQVEENESTSRSGPHVESTRDHGAQEAEPVEYEYEDDEYDPKGDSQIAQKESPKDLEKARGSSMDDGHGNEVPRKHKRRRKQRRHRKRPRQGTKSNPIDKDKATKRRLKNKRRKLKAIRYEIPAPIVASQIVQGSSKLNIPHVKGNRTVTKVADKSIGPVGIAGKQAPASSKEVALKSTPIIDKGKSKGKSNKTTTAPAGKSKRGSSINHKRPKQTNSKQSNIKRRDSDSAKGGENRKPRKATKSRDTPKSKAKGSTIKSRSIPSPKDPDPDGSLEVPTDSSDNDSDYYTSSSTFSKECDDDTRKCKIKSTESNT